jgi:hypothetical protein
MVERPAVLTPAARPRPCHRVRDECLVNLVRMRRRAHAQVIRELERRAAATNRLGRT